MNSFLKTPFQVFPYGICELFLRTSFLVHLRTTASLYTLCTHLSLLVILYFPIHLSSRPCNEKPVLIKQTNKKTALIICLNWDHPNIISLQPQKWIKNQGFDMLWGQIDPSVVPKMYFLERGWSLASLWLLILS